MGTKKPLSKKEIQEFKDLLLKIRAKIVGGLAHRELDATSISQKDASGDLSGYSFHMADVATDNFDKDLNFGLASNGQNILNEVDAALKRIENGTFGICEKYGTPIARARLKALPYVRYSLKAQEEEEKNRPVQ